MRNIILIIHLSVDGFAAGPNGELSYFSHTDDNLAFVNGITANADAALFGRNCYKLLDDFWPSKRDDPEATQAEVDYSNWYNAAQKIVVSTTLQNTKTDNVTIISEHPEIELQAIRQLPGKNILIFGSPSLSQFLLQKDLIDEYWVIMHSNFFGKGLPLFPGLSNKIDLTLLKIHPISTVEFALHYKK